MSFRENMASTWGWNRLHNFSQVSRLDESKIHAESQRWHFTENHVVHEVHDFIFSIHILSWFWNTHMHMIYIAYDLPFDRLDNVPPAPAAICKGRTGRINPPKTATKYVCLISLQLSIQSGNNYRHQLLYIHVCFHAYPSNNVHASLRVAFVSHFIFLGLYST